jgi:hypothetical protein
MTPNVLILAGRGDVVVSDSAVVITGPSVPNMRRNRVHYVLHPSQPRIYHVANWDLDPATHTLRIVLGNSYVVAPAIEHVRQTYIPLHVFGYQQVQPGVLIQTQGATAK